MTMPRRVKESDEEEENTRLSSDSHLFHSSHLILSTGMNMYCDTARCH
jgi:hypothetical protein